MTTHAKNPERPDKRGGDTSKFSSRNGGTWSAAAKVQQQIETEIKELKEEDKVQLKDLYSANGPYTPEEKLGACMAYVVTGSDREASKMTGIPSATIRYWKASAPWWPDTIAKLRKQKQDELDGRLTKVIHQAVDEIEDRLSNGDEVLGKDNVILKKKMAGRDIAISMGALFDKRQMIRGDPTSISAKGTTADQLKEIMTEFKQLASDIRSRQEKDVIAEEI